MIRRQREQMSAQYDPEMVKQLKKEIISDMRARREWQEKYYGDGYGPENGTNYRGRSAGYVPADGTPPAYRGRKPPEFDLDWWTDREEYEYQRNSSLLKNQLRGELQKMARTQERVRQIRDPQVRQMLHSLLQEAWEQGLSVTDVLQSLEINNGPTGYTGQLKNLLTNPLRGIDRRSFYWGIGAALVGFTFLPALGKSLRPLARKAVEEAMDIYENTQSVFAHAKEELEDIIAEANFNKLKESIPGPDSPGENNPN